MHTFLQRTLSNCRFAIWALNRRVSKHLIEKKEGSELKEAHTYKVCGVHISRRWLYMWWQYVMCRCCDTGIAIRWFIKKELEFRWAERGYRGAAGVESVTKNSLPKESFWLLLLREHFLTKYDSSPFKDGGQKKQSLRERYLNLNAIHCQRKSKKDGHCGQE